MKTTILKTSKFRAFRTLTRTIQCAAPLFVAACGKSTKVVVVLVDLSATVSPGDSVLYHSTFSAAVNALKPGDRLVLARISDRSVSTFLPDADRTLPVSGVELTDNEARDSVTHLLEGDYSRLERQGGSNETNILDAVNSAQEVYQRDRDHQVRWLVILSDMMHETHQYNFRTQRVDSAFTETVIQDRRRTGAYPQLRGIRIFVTGAGGTAKDPSKFYGLRAFWLRYFREAGAICDSTTYGRTALTVLQ